MKICSKVIFACILIPQALQGMLEEEKQPSCWESFKRCLAQKMIKKKLGTALYNKLSEPLLDGVPLPELTEPNMWKGLLEPDGDVRVAQELIKQNIDPNIRNKDTDMTPLMAVVQRGHAGMVAWLLEHRANPNGRVAGVTPVWEAATQNRPDIVDLLIDSGAQPEPDLQRSMTGLQVDKR